MANGIFHSARPFTKILLIIFLMLSSYLILFGIGILLCGPIFRVAPGEVITILENREAGEHIEMMKFLQVLYSVGLFLVPALLAGWLIQKNPWEYLLADRSIRASVALLVLILLIVSIPWINYLGFLNENLTLPARWSDLMEKIRHSDDQSWELMKSYLDTPGAWGLLFNLFMIAIIPSLGEEFFFRGVLQRIFSEWFKNGHLAVWIAAVLFSLAHYQFLGFIPRIILGALFGYIFLWTGSIWMPVLAHLVNNATAVIYYFLFLKDKLEMDPQQVGMQQNPMLFITASVLLTVAGMLAIRYMGKASTDTHLP